MNNCCKLLLLILILWNALTAKTIDCYVCSSLEDDKCESEPKKVVACPNISTACSKIVMKDIKYRYIFNNTEFNASQQNEVMWDGESLDWIVIAKPIYVTIRKCYNEPLQRIRTPGCYHYLDTHNKATVCKCTGDLCNDAAGLNFSLMGFITCYAFLQADIWRS
ncbi:hypothetical protein ILUMI_00765 [Ignelater luminosus]|uniref:Protein quiver n=1 Tax=Ignelater luminosus TaxID=2038154 RepID=A0A8K0GPW3_IGNLU|nr:hypothetical protein ILUMI_00765 [Ignelater luminosus]